jgi:hypothetical protein
MRDSRTAQILSLQNSFRIGEVHRVESSLTA